MNYILEKIVSLKSFIKNFMRKEMATFELDPLFVKALRLLHSKAKDSDEQLRQLLDDVLAKQTISTSVTKDRNSFGVIKQEDNSNSRLCSLSKKSSPNYGSDNGSSSSRLLAPEETRKEDKRKPEKVKQEPVEFPSEIKRPKLDSPQHSLSPTPSPQPTKTESAISKADDESDSSDMNADADEFAMEMGLACVVCKLIDVTHGNNLVECQECHSLYHQECHRPPVTDQDINDPRHVWYCSRCMKNMKKMASKTHKTSKTSSNSSTKETTPVFRNVKTETPSPTLLPFKRAEPRVPSSQPSGLPSTNKPFGLAGLAANLSGKSTASTVSVTSKSGSSAKPGNASSTPTSASKPFSPFTFLSSTRTTASVTQSKTTNSSGVSGLSSLATVASTLSKAGGTSTSTSHSKLCVGTLSSTVMPSSGKLSSGGNNGAVKSASSSSLMSADKRLQIMKKRAAAKMQEKRRLSTK